jgi:hypothetical protein
MAQLKTLAKYLLFFISLPTMVLSNSNGKIDNRINKLINSAKESCISDGGSLKLSGNEVRVFDFNSDNITDLTVLNEREYNCSSSASLFQGTAGAMIHMITDNDYISGYAREFEVITTFNNKKVILLNLHGVSCGEVGFVSCVQAITLHEGRFISN